MTNESFIIPNWGASKNIKALITTRLNGHSKGAFSSFNLAKHVNDNPEDVEANREILSKYLPASPWWLFQTHSDKVLNIDEKIEIENTTSLTTINSLKNSMLDYDASFTSFKNEPCVVMTADCLPILCTDLNGNFVSAIHAGWKGIALGIIEKCLNAFPSPSSEIITYIGPAICQNHFEVGLEVKGIFTNLNEEFDECFISKHNDKYACSLIDIAKLKLLQEGIKIENIYLSKICTFCNSDFFSYRRNSITGRFASIIWRT